MVQVLVRGVRSFVATTFCAGNTATALLFLEEAGKLNRPGPVALGYGRQSNRKGSAGL